MSPRQEPATPGNRQARAARPGAPATSRRSAGASPLAGGPREWSPYVWRQVVSLGLLALLAILGLVLVAMSSASLGQALALAAGVLVVVFSVGVLRFRR